MSRQPAFVTSFRCIFRFSWLPLTHEHTHSSQIGDTSGTLCHTGRTPNQLLQKNGSGYRKIKYPNFGQVIKQSDEASKRMGEQNKLRYWETGTFDANLRASNVDNHTPHECHHSRRVLVLLCSTLCDDFLRIRINPLTYGCQSHRYYFVFRDPTK